MISHTFSPQNPCRHCRQVTPYSILHCHRTFNNVKQAFDAELAQTDLTNQEAVNNLRVKYLGKKGAVTDLMKQMGSLSAEERPAYGKLVNELKVAVSEAIDNAIETANQAALQKKLESGFVDTTLPGAGIPAGSTHPLYDVREEIIDFFSQMGFEVDFGRDIETDWYNFEALNTPPDHPSRDMQDTFYVDDKVMLRTHTSGTQIHYMETHKPPFRMIAPGHVFRVDNDATRPSGSGQEICFSEKCQSCSSSDSRGYS